MYKQICFALLLVLSSLSHAKDFVVLGDSLSAGYGFDPKHGWVQLMQHKLSNQGDHLVINASISGDTTQGGLSRLPNIIQVQQPDTLIIELGGNDGLRGYPIRTIKNNLAAMIDLAQQHDIQVILVAIEIPPNYGQRYTAKFREMYRELAERYGVIFAPSFIDNIGTNAKLMQKDGIHPTEEAQPLMLENLWPSIEKSLQHN